MISEFELIEVLSICFEVSSSSLRQVMDYQFPPLMGPGRRATFGKCQLQQKFSFLIRWTFKLFVAIFCLEKGIVTISLKVPKWTKCNLIFIFDYAFFFGGNGNIKIPLFISLPPCEESRALLFKNSVLPGILGQARSNWETPRK